MHDLYVSLDPEQDPPFLSTTVLNLLNFWLPPLQLLEHDPLADQSDHWQLIGSGLIGFGVVVVDAVVDEICVISVPELFRMTL